MDLYFSPLACSMATRIAFYEGGIKGNFIAVDTQAKKLADGSDFFAVNTWARCRCCTPIRASCSPKIRSCCNMSPISARNRPGSANGIERYRLQQWLNFMTSELHKVVFVPLLDPTAPRAPNSMRAKKPSVASRI